MFIIVFLVTISLANCLEPLADDKTDDGVKKVITKYLNKIEDVEPQYVIHEGLSKVISRYFKGKVSTFPLYRISLKLDRNPVKIPWSLADPAAIRHPASIPENKRLIKGRSYKYIPQEKGNKTA